MIMPSGAVTSEVVPSVVVELSRGVVPSLPVGASIAASSPAVASAGPVANTE
jgi:hypothetical protein